MSDDLQAALTPETPASATETTQSPASEVSTPNSKASFREALGSHFEALSSKEPESGGQEPQSPTSGQAPAQAPTLSASPATTQTQVTQSTASHVPIMAPSDMKPEEKAAWEQSPALQAYLARRAYEMRADYRRQTQELEQQRKQVSSFVDVVERNKEHYILKGQDPAAVFERALAWDKRIQADPVSGALEYLQAYGIKPKDLIAAAEGQTVQQQEPTPVGLSQDDIQRLVDERLQAQMQEQQQKATAQQIENVVSKFIGSKPVLADPGTADAVLSAMAPFAQAAISANPSADPEKVLESVYKFVLAEQFPDLHSRLQARAIAEGKNSEAQKAKQAGKSISGSLSTGEPKRKFKGFREALEAHLR